MGKVVLIPEIPGLELTTGVMTPYEETRLVEIICAQPWDTTFSRRVQQYGWKYRYDGGLPTRNDYIGVLPDWCQELLVVVQERLNRTLPKFDQAIVNEYIPGQGIGFHIDSCSWFEDEILIVSLVSPVCMNFRYNTCKRSLDLPNRSVLILQGEARSLWEHGIVRRTFDMIEGYQVSTQRGATHGRRKREYRLSVTFRILRDLR